MAVTNQPRGFQQSEFQSGLCSCCDDCSVCKPPLGETPPGAASRVCGAHSVSLTSPLLPPNQASAGPSACRASAAPLPATWTNAACAECRWQYAASTGPDTTSRWVCPVCICDGVNWCANIGAGCFPKPTLTYNSASTLQFKGISNDNICCSLSLESTKFCLFGVLERERSTMWQIEKGKSQLSSANMYKQWLIKKWLTWENKALSPFGLSCKIPGPGDETLILCCCAATWYDKMWGCKSCNAVMS